MTAMRIEKENTKSEKSKSRLSAARRGVWFLLRQILVATLIMTLCYLALVEAFYVSNIYVIVTEGMEHRADCILGNIGINELSEHFYDGWIKRDAALFDTRYDAYRVDSYDHRLSIEKLRVYPWSSEASLQVVERVLNIQANPYNDNVTDPAPEWESSRLEIKLEKIEGRWYITELEVLERDPEGSPGATPDYSQLETDIPHY